MRALIPLVLTILSLFFSLSAAALFRVALNFLDTPPPLPEQVRADAIDYELARRAIAMMQAPAKGARPAELDASDVHLSVSERPAPAGADRIEGVGGGAALGVDSSTVAEVPASGDATALPTNERKDGVLETPAATASGAGDDMGSADPPLTRAVTEEMYDLEAAALRLVQMRAAAALRDFQRALATVGRAYARVVRRESGHAARCAGALLAKARAPARHCQARAASRAALMAVCSPARGWALTADARRAIAS